MRSSHNPGVGDPTIGRRTSAISANSKICGASAAFQYPGKEKLDLCAGPAKNLRSRLCTKHDATENKIIVQRILFKPILQNSAVDRDVALLQNKPLQICF
jgi:hypothetical protein